MNRNTEPIRDLLKWEKRVVFLENEWVITVHGGRDYFESLFKKNVTVVDSRKFSHPILNGLKCGQYGYLDTANVALMYHPQAPTFMEKILDPRFSVFRGKFEKMGSQLVVRGKFRTYTFARYWALIILNLWLGIGATIVTFGVASIAIESISNFSVGQMATGISYILATVAVTVLGFIGLRGLFKLSSLGSQRASAEVYRLLTMFAGTENSAHDKPD